jgi:hypothetical protein
MYAGFVTFSIAVELNRFETPIPLQHEGERFVRELRVLGALASVHWM